MRATLADVARASGVSKATASYVLNNKRSSFGLSAVTVRRVLEESRRLNYRPDLLAQALEGQKRMAVSIALLSPWLYSQFSDFMVQVSQAIHAEMAVTKLHVEYKLYKTGELKRVLSAGKSKKYDAVIVIGTNAADEMFLDRRRAEFSNVILLNRLCPGYPCSYGDDEAVCARLAERLVSADCYERYVLVHNPALSQREELRVAGHRKIISRAGKGMFCECFVVEPDREGNYLKPILSQYGSSRVCYIFTQYFPAACMMKLVNSIGLDVPRGIGIVGYDQHSLLKDFLNPRLTTVDPKIFEMTKQALAMARLIKAGECVSNCMVEAEIIPGESAVIH